MASSFWLFKLHGNACLTIGSLNTSIGPRQFNVSHGLPFSRVVILSRSTRECNDCCGPHSPWRRDSNEYQGLLRQYFPKGTGLPERSSNDIGQGILYETPRMTTQLSETISLSQTVMVSDPRSIPRQSIAMSACPPRPLPPIIDRRARHSQSLGSGWSPVFWEPPRPFEGATACRQNVKLPSGQE